MKVLYIGHYREGGGWSNAAMDYILALDSIGVDVVCRDIKLTNYEAKIPDRILELEQKSIQDVDYCIQHVLPHHLVGTDKFKKNIAYFVSESNDLSRSNWITNLNMMDEVWTANETNKSVLENSGIEVPVKVLPHASNLSKYSKEYDDLHMHEINDKFKFYYIGDMNDRKNISSVIRCFHSEFDIEDQVALVIKIKQFGVSPDQLKEQFVNFSNSIKAVMRKSNNLQDYCTELLITADMSDEQIQSLHKSCDCFVNISHGEAWSIPAFEAMAHGNTPICSDEGGPKEFIDRDNRNTGMLVNGSYGVCMHSNPAFPDLFTGREEWFIADESATKKAMRYYYEKRTEIDRADGLQQAQKFSYENVANKIKEYISE